MSLIYIKSSAEEVDCLLFDIFLKPHFRLRVVNACATNRAKDTKDLKDFLDVGIVGFAKEQDIFSKEEMRYRGIFAFKRERGPCICSNLVLN